jgi:transcriptional regulator of acetoin/glycerol metabolism
MSSLQLKNSRLRPGNVRELRNVIEHAMILSKSSKLVVPPPKSGLRKKDDRHNLDDMEREHITSILKKTGWGAKAAPQKSWA